MGACVPFGPRSMSWYDWCTDIIWLICQARQAEASNLVKVSTGSYGRCVTNWMGQ
jgi:hypothetical protein